MKVHVLHMKVHKSYTCVVRMIYTSKCTCVARMLHHDLVGKFYSVFHMCDTCLTHEIHMCPTPMLHMCSFGKGMDGEHRSVAVSIKSEGDTEKGS